MCFCFLFAGIELALKGFSSAGAWSFLFCWCVIGGGKIR